MMLLAFTPLIFCSLTAGGFRLQSRAIQTTAICSSDYSWADNGLRQSPCLVAANVDAACNEGIWTIPALNASNTYDAPVGPVATVCTCSWASYNLISACTDCQGFPNETMSWSEYSFGCAGKLTDTYFPSNLTLPGTQIPAWATTNPTTWPNAIFNAASALNISNEDAGTTSTSSSSPSKKSSPIGAIVGGVVGGLAILIAAIIIGRYLIRRTSQRKRTADPSPLLMANAHLRSHSDVTAMSNNNTNMSPPFGYTSLSSSPFPPSPTIRTHVSSSIRSFPYFSSGGSTPSERQQSPPPPPPPQVVSVPRNQTAVEPFTLPPTGHNPDRKQADGAYPVYDSPSALPTVRMDVLPTTPTQTGRTRYNPPAYSEQTNASPEAGGSSSSSQRSPPNVGPGHVKGSSADRLLSFTSGRSAPRVGGSNSPTGNRLAPPIRTQLNLHDGNASMYAISGHERQLSGNTSSDMDRSRRRLTTDDGFSVRDIA